MSSTTTTTQPDLNGRADDQPTLAPPDATTAALCQALLQTAPDGILCVDGEGRILILNAQIERMFGYPEAELIGQSLEILLPERFRKTHVSHRLGYHSAPRTRPMGAGIELLGRRQD